MTRRRAVRSYVIRAGRLTPAQGRALEALLPRYGIVAAAVPAHRQRPLHLEIGIGNGEQLVALAARHPGHEFIGCEVHPPGLGHALLRLEAAGLTNLRLHAGDAVDFLDALPAAVLDSVAVFFPDPWPKTRHHKRRLVGPPLLSALQRALKRGGRFYFASDDEDYAARVRTLLSAGMTWCNLAGHGRFAPRPCWRLETRFEQRAGGAGATVWDLAAARIE